MGIQFVWDCELPKTPEGFYQLQSGIDYAIGELRPHTSGSELLELAVLIEPSREKLVNVIFADIQDRRGRKILSVRDQNRPPQSHG